MILPLMTYVLAMQVNWGESAGMGTHIPSFAGPVTVSITRVVPCPNEMVDKRDFNIYGIIKQMRDRKTPRFYGSFENRLAFDDSTQVKAELASWSNVAGWIPNAFILKFDKFCSDVKFRFGSIIRILEKHSVSGGMKLCPRQAAGNYTVDGAPMVYNPIEFASLPYGRWRGDFSLVRNKETVGCFRITFLTIPRMANIDE